MHDIKMQTITVSTLEDFKKVIERMTLEHKDKVLLFRGQTLDRPMIPSILRGKGEFHAPGCNPSLMVNWQIYSKKLIKTLGTSASQDQNDAIMQHYGYRSFFIDVTFDPEVALWFALHKFESKKTACYVNDELKSAVFQVSKYNWVNQGFAYIIGLPKDQEVHFVNLFKKMPLTATRIHRQKAGALYYHNIKPVDQFIICKIHIPDSNSFKDSLTMITTEQLFPSPIDDLFYKYLCTIPYVTAEDITTERKMQITKIGHPLLGEFPIYADSPKLLVQKFLPLTRVIDQIYPSLKWDVATAVTEFEGHKVKVRGASRIIVQKFMLINPQTDFTMLPQSLPSNNIIIEYELEASLMELSVDALTNFTRGLWVIIGEKFIKTVQLVDDFNTITLGHECIYSKSNLALISKNCQCKNHQSDLQVLIELGRGLLNGDFVLTQADNGYFLLRPREK